MMEARSSLDQRIATVALVVRDYDEAIEFYTGKLGFRLVEDTRLDETKRWVIVAPRGQGSASLLLARAADSEQSARVGNQTGGRVLLFLETDDFDRDYASMREKGVEFLEQPRDESYAKVAQFRDLYGNKWDLLHRK